MNTKPELLTPAFRALSARLGQDPLQVQGPGGNTSIKEGDVMWVKASGTELAEAETRDIFVPVNRTAAVAEARREAGDGTCVTTVLGSDIGLRPSIETTFHAALEHAVVAHTHSVATLTHAICSEGRDALRQKLAGLDFVTVPYAKPGLDLTQQILARVAPQTQVIVLENHGLVCCGAEVEEVSALLAEVERRLSLPARAAAPTPTSQPPAGFDWADASWIARDGRACGIALAGSYYPDHVVFLGPALREADADGKAPAVLVKGQGTALRTGATSSQAAMLTCLSDVLLRLPEGWTPAPIGPEAEASLLNWDAEKYRQALAAGA